MSGGTWRGPRCFESNAINLANEAEANKIADDRNNYERQAGRTEDEVLWFPTQFPVF